MKREDLIQKYQYPDGSPPQEKNLISQAHWIALLFVLGAIFYAGSQGLELWRTYLLRNGAVAQATIIDRDVNNLEKPTFFYITYRFDDYAEDENDRRFIHRSSVPEARYESLRVGDTIPIRYNPSNPSQFQAEGYQNVNYIHLLFGLCSLMIAFILLFLVFMNRRYYVQRYILDYMANPDMFRPTNS